MAFGRAKEQTRVTLHLGGRDFDIHLEGDQSKAFVTAQQGMVRGEIITIRAVGAPMMAVNWGAVPAFTVGETTPLE